MAKSKKTSHKRRFRLMQGRHNDGDKTYVANTKDSLIDTTKDLAAIFGADKFQEVGLDATPIIASAAATPKQNLEELEKSLSVMSVAELNTFAAEEEIDLTDCDNKAEMILTICQAVQATES